MAEHLDELGITSYQQLADISAEDLLEKLKTAGAKGLNKGKIGSLAEQAALAAKGDWDALDALKKKL